MNPFLAFTKYQNDTRILKSIQALAEYLTSNSESY